MPQFTQWTLPDPSPNILYNPAAVDAAIAKTQSELGNLDIERKKFGLEQARFDRGVTEGEGYISGSLSGTTGNTGAGVGGTYAPGTPFTPKMLPPGVSLDEDAMVRTIAGEAGAEPLQGQIAVAHVINTRAKGAGVSPRDVVFSPNQFEPWNGGAARARLEAMQPTDPQYQAILNNVVRPAMSGKAADPTGGATHFYAPVAQKALGRDAPSWGQGTPSAVIGGHNFYKVGYGPGQARVAAAPDATPVVAPQAAPGVTPPTAPGVNPNAMVKIPPTAPIVAAPAANPNAGPRVGSAPTVPAVTPAIAPSADPNARAEADDPNTAAVKQAATALLNMPEPVAAAAYPAVVRELQARGFAMQAPPTYPGHAALQALVGGGDVAAPAVEPSRMAMRLGGTDTAGPGAGQATVPPDVQPNQLAYGTGLPGVTIGMPGNGLAPQPTATSPSPVQTAAAPAQAQPQAANPQPIQPPPAPTRVIPREPLLSNNLTAAQQDAARRAIRAGTPLATVQAHVEQWKQENVAARHQDAVDAAAQQQANYARQEAYRKAQIEDEKTQYDRKRQAEKDAREAADAAKLQQSKGEDGDSLRVLQAIAPKIRNGQELTEEEADMYDLHRRRWAQGPLQMVSDGKGGTIQANVGREISDRFPPLPGQKEYAGLRPIPGTEKQADPAPPNVITSMLDIQAGNRTIVKALDQLEAYPGGVGLVPGAQPTTMSNWTDPAGVKVRSAIGIVQGHIYHDQAGTAQSAAETGRLRSYVPSDKDDAVSAKTKLRQMLDNNRETLLDHYATFGPEAGYRRQPGIEREILSTIPENAVEHLKENPKTAKEFDKMFGRGAAKLALQND
jgi:hypothetical protein